MPQERALHIASFPEPYHTNPFLSLLYEHLGRAGVELVPSGYFGVSWLRRNRGKIDYIHFHWPSGEYSNASGKRSLAALAKFLAKMTLAKLWGYRFIWTVHNLYPHERQGRWVEWAFRFVFAHYVDLVFVLFADARDDLRRHFMRSRAVYVVPHGNYAPVYPTLPDAAQARRDCGVAPPATFSALMVGQMRPYKGADAAIAAFRHLPDQDCQLLLIGQAADAAYAASLRAHAADDPRVRIVLSPEGMTDAEVGAWMAACDCVLAPYRDVHGSGVLYLAATFGKPIIAPARGIFRELRDQPFVASFDPADGDAGIARALAALRGADPVAVRESALAFARAHDWNDIARRVADILARDRGIAIPARYLRHSESGATARADLATSTSP